MGLGFRLLKVLVLVAHGWLVMPEIFVFPMVGVLASHVYKNHMKKCPYFWKVQWGVLRVKFPNGQTKSKSFEAFEGEV